MLFQSIGLRKLIPDFSLRNQSCVGFVRRSISPAKVRPLLTPTTIGSAFMVGIPAVCITPATESQARQNRHNRYRRICIHRNIMGIHSRRERRFAHHTHCV
jgi:hypothetical protein